MHAGVSDDARSRGWGWPGAPGSAEERAYRWAHLTTIVVVGIRLVVRKEVAGIFNGFLTELAATGYRLDIRADDWGWANRDIRGRPGVKSNHAWGLANDLNAVDNPMTSDGRVHTDMPPGTAELAARWGLRWGANYTGRVDPMHFEFMGRPEDVGRYPLGHVEPSPSPLPQIASTRHTIEGEPVMRIDVPVRTDSSGNGYTGPDEGVLIEHAKVLAVTSHAPHSPAGADKDYLLAPVGHHELNGNLVVQVVGGPRDATVFPIVLVADA